MRVLVTGLLPINAKRGRRRVERCVQGDCLERLAEMCGYEVEHRPVDPAAPGEWDVAFVALAVPRALGAMYAAGALSILGRPGVVPHFDYWDVTRTMNGVLALRQEGHAQSMVKVPGMKHPEWLQKHGDQLMDMAEMAVGDGWPLALAPLFPWGDHKKFYALLPWVKKWAWLDFSAAEPHYLGEGYEPKWEGRRREWVWALHNGWYPGEPETDTSWRYRLIGRAAERKAPLLPEQRVNELYSEAWGVRITPNKDRRGDGWFKNTYCFAARAGAVLWLDQEDAAGTAYDIVADRHERRMLEVREDEFDIAAAAQYQREWFFDHSWGLPTLKEKFRRLCERVADS